MPRHSTDLLNPKWKGKLGANRNNFMFLAALLHLYGKEKGEDFLRKLAQQSPQFVTGAHSRPLSWEPEITNRVFRQCHNVENVKESGSPVDWVRIEDPLYGEPHPAAVMARTPHPNAARLFVEFAISKEGSS